LARKSAGESAGGKAWLSRSLMTAALSRLRTAVFPKTSDGPRKARKSQLDCREREIVALVATGIHGKGVAEKLFVSEATVRNHLTSIFGKLDLSNQFELVFYAQRLASTNLLPAE
jgi:DNA-binding NarL/FixJ family response regulator